MHLRLITNLIILISIVMSHDIENLAHARDLVIDDRSSADLHSNLGPRWHLVTDDVMGGLSSGTFSVEQYRGKACLRMQADVSTENNGGFVQIALPLSDEKPFDASSYTGVEIEVSGNSENYNIHFRTDSLWFPWQSYRYSFTATPDWQTYRIPFTDLTKYKTFSGFDKDEITRIGLVAIGRDFKADVRLASIKFYSE